MTKKNEMQTMFTNQDGIICLMYSESFNGWDEYKEGDVRIEVPAVNVYTHTIDKEVYHKVKSFHDIKINGSVII